MQSDNCGLSSDPNSPIPSTVVNLNAGIDRRPLIKWQRGLALLTAAKPTLNSQHLIFSADISVTDDSLITQSQEWLRALIRRHPMLRTRLSIGELTLENILLSHIEPDIRIRDCRTMGVEDLRSLARDECRAAFDLSDGPLWRVHLYQRTPKTTLLCLVLHHALFDFWSLGLLLTEALGFLRVPQDERIEVDGSGFLSHEYPSLRSQFQDDPSPLQAFWSEYLRGISPVHSLATDFPRGVTHDEPGGSVYIEFDKQISDLVPSVCKQAGVTPFMLFLSLWSMFLSRLAIQSDWVIACPTVQRMSRESRRQLGQFVNVLPFRLQTNTHHNLLEHLSLNKTSIFEVLRHQDATVEQIIDWLQLPRSALYAPITQIGFAWERIPLLGPFESFFLPSGADHTISTEGAVLRPFFVPQQEGQYELSLEMGGMAQSGAHVAQLKYRSDLFSQESMTAWAEAFKCFASEALLYPERSAFTLSMLTFEQKNSLIIAGPSTPSTDQTVLDRFAVISTRHSTYVALAQSSSKWTYKELASSVNRLANRLKSTSIQPGSHVGVACTRGGGWIVALLAVWSVGAVYVPIDLGLPIKRIQYMLQDADLKCLLVDDSGQAYLSDDVPADFMLNMDHIPLEASDHESSPVTLVEPDSPAYLLYTSGSTGQPKGVRVSHRSLFNLLGSMQDILQLTPQDRWLSLTTPSFDISLLEMLLPLMQGASVFVCNKTEAADMDLLAQCITKNDITVMQATPTHWRLLLGSGWLGAPGLKALCGGEALSGDLAQRLLAHVHRLWNVYGPTETTIWSTCSEVFRDQPIVLGKPLANTQLVVLDEHQRPCVPGVVGELWIGGQGVAIDYFKQPSLSSQRFQMVEQYPQLGRLYRTGDFVRVTDRYDLQYHGRNDGQIKLSGHRIELGEVEQAFSRIAPNSQSVALVIKLPHKSVLLDPSAGQVSDTANDSAALVIATVGQYPADWADALRSVLPSYMVPQKVIPLNSFSQTPNGKVDKAQLASICTSLYSQQTQDDRLLRQPRNHEEAQLMPWFAEVLGKAYVPLEQSFFDLGGQSLQAVQLMALIKRQTGMTLPSALLLEYPSVEALAAYVRRYKKSQAASAESGKEAVQRSVLKTSQSLILNQGAPGVTPLWLFHPIGGTIFCYSPLCQALDPRRPVYAFEAMSLTDPLQAEVSIDGLATRYVDSVLSVQSQGPYLLGGWCFGGLIAYEVARLLSERGHPVEAVLMLDTRAPSGEEPAAAVTDAQLLEWFSRDLARAQGKRLVMDWESLADQGHQMALQLIHRQAIRESLLPSDTLLETVELAFNTFLAHGIALQTHELTGVAGSGQTIQTLLVIAQDEPEDFGHHLGWDRWIHPFQLKAVSVSGDHYSIMHKPDVDTVADLIEMTFPIYTVAAPSGDTVGSKS